jgi:aminoglycoside phosphotransferase (APT) family kinase protein
MPVPIAADDIVRTRGDIDCAGRLPLIVLDELVAFLDAHDLGAGEPVLAPIGDGRSNVTYLVTRGETRFVLRRPPRPPLPPSAHDVVREARVLSALGGHVPVPEVLAVCATDAVIGAPFYVMEMVDGYVVNDTLPAGIDPRRISDSLIDALVDMHRLDWRAAGLEGIGKPSGYLERQLRRFLGLWEHNKTRELPAVESVGRWLATNMPASPAATLVHGDYRLGNAIVDDQRVVAILDWEMATIGDPLADLGYLCALWSDRGDAELGMFEPSPVTRQEGFPTRLELTARYEERSGRSASSIGWYETLALWKAIVFMEGNYKRAREGATDDAFLASFGDGVIQLADRAEALTHERTS